MAATVIADAARCVGCGTEFRWVAWEGDESDRRYFPVEFPWEDLAAGGGTCAHCGGQIQFELRAAADDKEYKDG